MSKMKFAWIILLPCILANVRNRNLKEVYVEKFMFDLPQVEKHIRSFTDLRTVRNTPTSLLTGGENIKIYCIVGSNKVLYSNIEVSPRYENKTEGLECFTNLNADKAFGAAVSAVNPSELRPPSNLVNGINPYQHDFCAETGGFENPWFLVDLNKVVDVSRVVVSTHPHGYLVALPGRMDIKYAEDLSESDFKTWKEYRGSDLDSGKNLEFTADVPLKARYFLFEKFKSANFTNFMMCGVQVF